MTKKRFISFGKHTPIKTTFIHSLVLCIGAQIWPFYSAPDYKSINRSSVQRLAHPKEHNCIQLDLHNHTLLYRFSNYCPNPNPSNFHLLELEFDSNYRHNHKRIHSIAAQTFATFGSPSTRRISSRRMAVGPNKERVGLESGAKAPRGLRMMPAALLHYLIHKI